MAICGINYKTNGEINFGNGGLWLTSNISTFSAIGGNVVISGGYKYHKFLTSGSLVCTGSGAVEAYIVGGGGGGGFGLATGEYIVGSGGGGSGSVIYNTYSPMYDTITIVVGGGGGGSSQANKNGGDGHDTSIVGISIGTVTASGGGGGGSAEDGVNHNDGSNGGCGGGGSGGRDTLGGTGTNGYDGGIGTAEYCAGGGGGGAGGIGGSGNVSVSPYLSHGGDGITFVWDTTYNIGGGGCGNGQLKTNSYGGGDSGMFGDYGGNGTPNTGGGGGGTTDDGSAGVTGGSGGSGFVIIRYPI